MDVRLKGLIMYGKQINMFLHSYRVQMKARDVLVNSNKHSLTEPQDKEPQQSEYLNIFI